MNFDGSDDTSRETIFIGNTQLGTPQGPIPMQAVLEATSIEEVMELFPKAMELETHKVIENFKRMEAQLIKALGQQTAANGWVILYIGDLAQEKGFPMPSGHASHQNGLDADVLLTGIGLKDDLFLNETQCEQFEPQAVLNQVSKGKTITL